MKPTITLKPGSKIDGHRGWDYTIRLHGREIGSGWTSGSKIEARAEAEGHAAELMAKFEKIEHLLCLGQIVV